MKILASKDTHVEGKVIRTFTVLAAKPKHHPLRVRTVHGVVHLGVLQEARNLFAHLGKVHHVAPTHHREWQVWVELNQHAQ